MPIESLSIKPVSRFSIICVLAIALVLISPNLAKAESREQAVDRLTDVLFYRVNPQLNNRKLQAGDNPEKSSTIEISSQQVQISLENYANASEKLPLQKGMAYKEARQILMKQGWQPNLQGETNLRSLAVKELFDLGYKEIKDCSGTGEGLCRFEFINKQGEILVVVTAGLNKTVRNWWIEKNLDSGRQKSSSNIIQEGCYWRGGTDRGLEVKGKQYRYYGESNIDRPWKPVLGTNFVIMGDSS
jgi:hypothetical protein